MNEEFLNINGHLILAVFDCLNQEHLSITSFSESSSPFEIKISTKEEIKALLYDLGFKDYTDEQLKIINEFCEKWNLD